MNKTDHQNNEFELLIINYLTGSISEEELSRLIDWIKKSPQNRELFNSLRNTWLLAGYRNDNREIQPEEYINKKDPSLLHVRFRALRYLKIAASWIVFLALGSMLTLWFSKKNSNDLAYNTDKKVEIYSPLGSRNRILMPDSTIIWLNAGTTIRYDQDYGVVSRNIDLDGEAYFDVRSDSRHPFIVHTSELDVMALGTRFNVKAYPGEETITATLEEGKINITVPGLNKEKENIILKPNENFIFHKDTQSNSDSLNSTRNGDPLPSGADAGNPGGIDIIPDVRTELYTSWKDQRWIIEREPFKTLFPMLERRYNMKVVCQEQKIMDFKFTGTVENENVEQMFNAIRFTAPVEYAIVRDTVYLYLDTDAYEKFRETLSGRK